VRRGMSEQHSRAPTRPGAAVAAIAIGDTEGQAGGGHHLGRSTGARLRVAAEAIFRHHPPAAGVLPPSGTPTALASTCWVTHHGKQPTRHTCFDGHDRGANMGSRNSLLSGVTVPALRQVFRPGYRTGMRPLSLRHTDFRPS